MLARDEGHGLPEAATAGDRSVEGGRRIPATPFHRAKPPGARNRRPGTDHFCEQMNSA